MKSGQLEIIWHGPYTLYGAESNSVLTTPLSKRKGIYLWTVPIEDKYLTYYVGETGRSFATRFVEHTRDVLYGLYRVYDPNKFAQGSKILIWEGMWKPERRSSHTMLEFLNRYLELSPLFYQFLGQLRFFLAPVDAEKRIRQRIEAAIAKKLLQQHGIVGEFQDNDIRYLPKRVDEGSITVTMKSFEPILGLTSKLLV